MVAVVKDGGGWEAERGREGRRVTGFEASFASVDS